MTEPLDLAEAFARTLAANALERAEGHRENALILCSANAGMFDELAVAETTSQNIRATHADDAVAWRRAAEIIKADVPMTFHEAAMLAAFSDKPVCELLEIPADIAENIDAANWKAGTGLADDSERRIEFRRRRAAAEAAAAEEARYAETLLREVEFVVQVGKVSPYIAAMLVENFAQGLTLEQAKDDILRVGAIARGEGATR